jgi:hypothetical protein
MTLIERIKMILRTEVKPEKSVQSIWTVFLPILFSWLLHAPGFT